MRWSITVNLTNEEIKAAKKLCIDLATGNMKIGIGAWVAELIRMDLEAREEGNYAVIRFNPEKLKESLDAQKQGE